MHGFVHQSGGLLRIESAPGSGTTVRIFLPRTAPQSAGKAPVAEAEIPTAATSSATLLLVDDETAVRKPAADQLRDLGYTVAEAADGAAALRLLDDGLRPELLVTDVGLPGGMDGRTLAATVRERIPGLPVLFITGFAHVPLPEDVAVIAKPFGLDLLARRIADTLPRLQ